MPSTQTTASQPTASTEMYHSPDVAALIATMSPPTARKTADEQHHQHCEHKHKQGFLSRLRGGGAAKDCFIGAIGCFLCCECCEVRRFILTRRSSFEGCDRDAAIVSVISFAAHVSYSMISYQVRAVGSDQSTLIAGFPLSECLKRSKEERLVSIARPPII
ncbi:hypothetical protein NP233_g771 [Leucocoprinus birnbaumii]|uniref:Uncharacterized protein n=1 Tax=Leucocoprinus birnbaumii TaxID=56174 RepID=A0AAD5YYF9_9AGAR|nr:hypothetical protein NP233_g771 [Leucocoprinus birnbaumii]